MKTALSIIILVFGLSISHGQEFKYGKVSKEELEEKIYAKDSSAPAAVLYRYENIHFVYTDSDGFIQEREVFERIKIYNKDGFDWATKKIYLYDGGGSSREKLSALKGQTFNLVDGKVVKSKVKKDGIFKEEYSEFTNIHTITMPNIKEGSVIEYQYKISSPFIVIDDIIFQKDIPIKKLDIEIATPEYYVYNKQYNLKAAYLPKQITSVRNHTIPFEYKTNVISFNEVNIPALKEEAYAGNINNYRSKMSLEISSLLNQYGIVEKSFSTSWDKVSKTIYESGSFGNQLNKSGFFKEDIAAIASSVTDDFQKAFLIHDYVKSKVKWNGYYGYRAQKGIRNAYKEGEGNIADINLLLIAMLRSQGVSANPVLVSTRDQGIPLFPTRKGFNYVICMVQNSDSYVLLDASNQFSTVNVLPERILNWQGRLIKEDGTSSWVSLSPNSPSTQKSVLNIAIDDDLSVHGKVIHNITSHLALRYREKYTGMTVDDHIKAIEKNKGDIEVSELNFENAKNVYEPVKVSYNYALSDGIDDISGKLYFSPLLFFAAKENPFKLEERQYPIDFVVPFEEKQMVNIMLPEGYKVESLPKSEAYDFNNGKANFTYILRENGKYLQMNLIFKLNSTYVSPQDYSTFKDFYSKFIEKQAEQIVLVKA